ncbi:MAG: hypothetical protein FWG40_04685 [Peptococcaceae bacterium]|nr:hypothetical protein [Peptococcaceae bacterium]
MEKKRKTNGFYPSDGRYPTDNTNTARQLEFEYNDAESVPQPVTKPRSKSAAIKRRQRKQKRMLKILATSLIFIVAFGAIAGKAANVHLVKANQVYILEDEIKKLNLENAGLKRTVDDLSAVTYIEKQALAMGMEKPEGTLYVENNLLNSHLLNTQEAGDGKSDTDRTGQAQGDEENNLLQKVFGALITVIAD